MVQDTGRNSPNLNEAGEQRGDDDDDDEEEEEERRETGRVKFAVYKTYWKVTLYQFITWHSLQMSKIQYVSLTLKAVGALLSPTILLSLLAMQVFKYNHGDDRDGNHNCVVENVKPR